MGHKVTPISNRLAISRTSKSCWTSSYSYAEKIQKDLKLRKYVDKLATNVDYQPKLNSSLRSARFSLGLIRTKYKKQYNNSFTEIKNGFVKTMKQKNQGRNSDKRNTLKPRSPASMRAIVKRDRMFHLFNRSLPTQTTALFGNQTIKKIEGSLPSTKEGIPSACSPLLNGAASQRRAINLKLKRSKKVRNSLNPGVDVFIQASSKSNSMDLFTAAPTLYAISRPPRTPYELQPLSQKRTNS